MRIAVFSRWNATCGVSLHAEILVREWVRRGLDVSVYAPLVREEEVDWHHKKLEVEDEDYVRRVYVEGEDDTKYFKVSKEELMEYDIVFVESHPYFPHKSFVSVFKELRNPPKLFVVVHEGNEKDVEKASETIVMADGVIVFDFRFIGDVLGKLYQKIRRKIYIISYPAYDRIEETEAKKAGRKFGEPKLILFTYGRQPAEEYKDYIKVTEILVKQHGLDLEYRIMRSNGLIEEAKKPWIKQWRERPPLEKIYDYLVESDIHLLPKGRTNNTVVSSTIYQSLSSLTPTIAPSTKHFELITEDDQGVGAVLKYRNIIDLEHRLLRLVEDEEFRDRVVEAMKEFVKERNHRKIAEQYIELFKRATA